MKENYEKQITKLRMELNNWCLKYQTLNKSTNNNLEPAKTQNIQPPLTHAIHDETDCEKSALCDQYEK